MLMTQKIPSDLDAIKARFHQTELELNSILEITQAINNNASEDSLYAMYKFTLRGNLRVEKMALYVLDEEWECKVYFGTQNPFLMIDLDLDALQDITEISRCAEIPFENEIFKEFEIVIPVMHKDRVLAYVFINSIGKVGQLDTRFVQALSNIIIVAIENKKLVRRQIRQETIKNEMDIARKVQSMLFPQRLPYREDVMIKATYFPHDMIGGDYYDYVELDDNKFIICIADVSGKGVPAALLMSNFQALMRSLLRQTDDLTRIVEELNLSIYDNARGEHFITFFIALHDRKEHTLRYINAGHNPPFFYNFDRGEDQLLEEGTTVLGAFSPLPFIHEQALENIQNFFLFTYTDGVTEVNNSDDEQFGLERLIRFLRTWQKNDLAEIHGNLISRINQFKKLEKYVDDITLLSCRVKNIS